MENYGRTKYDYKNEIKRFPTYRFSPTTRIINIIVRPIFPHGLIYCNYD